jgi:hypothetical protein
LSRYIIHPFLLKVECFYKINNIHKI